MLKNPSLSVKYIDFMKEYIDLGHMKEISSGNINAEGYYIPHHAVAKSHSSNGKIRVVFNASQKTSNGESLNSIMLSGPRLQADLWIILTRWQFFQVVVATDIYGVTSAAFLALCVLQQLADDEGHRFPLAANVIRQNSYVDDFFFGADSINEVV